MSVPVALVMTLVIGLLCGYKVHQTLLWPPRGPIEIISSIWWTLRYLFDDALYSRNDDMVQVMMFIVEAQQAGRRISTWDITKEAGMSAKRANRCIDALLDAGVLICEEGCETETLPDLIFVVIATSVPQPSTQK